MLQWLFHSDTLWVGILLTIRFLRMWSTHTMSCIHCSLLTDHDSPPHTGTRCACNYESVPALQGEMGEIINSQQTLSVCADGSCCHWSSFIINFYLPSPIIVIIDHLSTLLHAHWCYSGTSVKQPPPNKGQLLYNGQAPRLYKTTSQQRPWRLDLYKGQNIVPQRCPLYM